MKLMVPELGLLVFAVASGVRSVQLFSQSKSRFGLYWEWRAMNGHEEDRIERMREADAAKRCAERWLLYGFIFFTLGSCSVLGALWATDIPPFAAGGGVTIQK